VPRASRQRGGRVTRSTRCICLSINAPACVGGCGWVCFAREINSTCRWMPASRSLDPVDRLHEQYHHRQHYYPSPMTTSITHSTASQLCTLQMHSARRTSSLLYLDNAFVFVSQLDTHFRRQQVA